MHIPKAISCAFILTVLSCVGFYLYTQWDIQRFEASLGKLPTLEASQEIDLQREVITNEHADYPAPAATVEPVPFQDHVLDVDVPEMEMLDSPIDETDMPLMESDLEELSLFEVELPEMSTPIPVEGIDWTQVEEAGRDYNDFLETDPEYAYERLDESFREMYGDHPEVDIIVETIKRANQQTMTVDDAIQMAEALLSIMPEESHGSISMLSDQLEMLHELKALKAYGDKVEIKYKIKVGE